MDLAKIFNFFLILIFPITLIVLGEFIFKSAFHSLQSTLLKTVMYGGLGIVLFTIISATNSYALRALNLKPIFWGDGASLIWGISIGLLISIISGVGFGISNGFSFQIKNLILNLDTKLIANLYPAMTEEAYFRAGIVNLLTQLFGQTIGILSGSVPFGVIHIIGSFFGKTVTVAQILGISLAGLMLSLMYLRFGLIGAISCHLVWNALVSGWAKVYGSELKTIESQIEGSWITCTILILVCIFLYYSSPDWTQIRQFEQ